jgi:hypothetical protein
MSRQLQAKEISIFGDSNVRRNLRAYSQPCDFGLDRTQKEFKDSLKLLEPDKYRNVIFAMMTNFIVSAGDLAPSPATRLPAIETCIRSLVTKIRYSPRVNS